MRKGSVGAVVDLTVDRLSDFADQSKRTGIQRHTEPWPLICVELAGLEIGVLGEIRNLPVTVVIFEHHREWVRDQAVHQGLVPPSPMPVIPASVSTVTSMLLWLKS